MSKQTKPRASKSSLKDHRHSPKENDGKEMGRRQHTSQQGPSQSRRAKSSKSIRFKLPIPPNLSEDSFSSARSHDVSESEESDDGEESCIRLDYQPSQESVLQKIIAPKSSSPRGLAKKHYVNKSSDALILPVSSSRQSLEVPSDTSDPDFHLIKSIYLRKLEGVKEAIYNGAKVNGISENQAPLMIATELGDDRMVAFLLTVQSINPDTTDNFGQTPLIIAVRNAFDNIVRLLLNHNADANIADHMGKTPLHGVLFQKRPNMAKLLLAYGADVEKYDCFGEKPIYTSAVTQPSLECLVTLLKMGAAVNYTNISGIPLLSRTIMNGSNPSIVEALVKYGASVNAQDLVSRKTPLHFAALKNDVNIIKILLKNGADPKLTSIYNFTPLDEAMFYRNEEAAEYLRRYNRGRRRNNVQHIDFQFDLHRPTF